MNMSERRGVDLHFEVYAPAMGTGSSIDERAWITLIHGGLVASPSWERQVKDLSPNLVDAYRVLTLDLRGYGRSPEAPEDGRYDVESFAADIHRLWQRLGIERSAVIGFSMGGFVAQELALEHPEMVSALVLVSTGARLSPALRAAFASRAKEIDEHGLALEMEQHVAKSFSEEFRLDQPELIEEYVAHMADSRPRAVAATFRELEGFDRSDDLDRLRCPVMVMCGELDPGLGPAFSQDLSGRIRGSELLVVPRVGHAVQIENPNTFNRQVLDFLGRHASTDR